jgi:hypothetical protein
VVIPGQVSIFLDAAPDPIMDGPEITSLIEMPRSSAKALPVVW